MTADTPTPTDADRAAIERCKDAIHSGATGALVQADDLERLLRLAQPAAPTGDDERPPHYAANLFPLPTASGEVEAAVERLTYDVSTVISDASNAVVTAGDLRAVLAELAGLRERASDDGEAAQRMHIWAEELALISVARKRNQRAQTVAARSADLFQVLAERRSFKRHSDKLQRHLTSTRTEAEGLREKLSATVPETSEAHTLWKWASSGEYSASTEAVFDAAANEIFALREKLAEAAQLLAAYVRIEGSISTDLQTAHGQRGDGASSFMREDDADLREHWRATCRAAAAWGKENS